ncbi:NAD/NADP octopine/nopaline dehydrogenase family protein [Vagococcus elongatus]|uniref:Dehydrogenase n=1 Tax=Vagococcus elongatus TaxID=180344 RepID=A0A430ASH7_9ENTE|nr:NAD/NADP octopine/nopaline dehydrogenase family protein [Vagococcus elongatus]RSU10996.1 dehydrogenase [Vagococcus elongatus]
MTTVAVLGGGNGGHAAAADLTLRGFDVRMYEDEAFIGKMKKVAESKNIHLSGACGNETVRIGMVTSDLKEAVADVKYILVVVPAFAHEIYAKKLSEVVQPGQIIFLLPGTFGSLIFWKELKKAGKEGVILAETHTLPYAARLVDDGEILVMSRFNPLKVGVMPASKTRETVAELSQFFDGLEPSESVIACGLSSLNPIIHVPGCILNAGRIEYAKGDFFFYTEGFTDSVVRTVEAVDAERIVLLKSFEYQWDVVAHGIGSGTETDDVKQAVAENPNFAKIKGPANVKDRYYSEDIPFGIAQWAKLAKQVGVQTPVMDSLVNLGSLILEEDCWTAGHSLESLGIQDMSLERLKLYMENGE